ncbi:MAG: transposase [Deltaproteobacteria bacterium]|nr:transposase [Deltaproteobacteria bacterium]
MPRTSRLYFPGGVFHLVSRFARDEWWLDREGARQAYLELLEKASRWTDVMVLAYCLMSNHIHLVVVQGQASLERFSKSVHTGFASWVHRSQSRTKALGAVFAGRPRSVLIEQDSYLLELVRYVHNNPVRAGVVRYARNSTWSSHQAYVGRVQAPQWLAVGYVLERFGRASERAAERFDAFVDQGRKQGRLAELSGAADAGEAAALRRSFGDGYRVSDGVLGSTDFVTRVRKDAERVGAGRSTRVIEPRAGAIDRPSVREVIDAVLQVRKLDPIELQERPRGRAVAEAKRLAIWVWVHEYEGRQIEVARALSLDTSVVSRYYGQALRAAGDFDERATAVTALLRKSRRATKGRRVTKATQNAFPVRYFL